MLAIVIILLVVVVVELVVCLAIHFDRKKTHAVYQFMADMVSEEGGALQKALEDLKESSTYAEPAESAAAIGEIVRFLESFNSTVRKQAERIEEARQNKWYGAITGLLKKKKKVDYSSIIKKKTADKKKPEAPEEEKEEEETVDSELEKIEEKIQEKLEASGSGETQEKIENKPAPGEVRPKKMVKIRKRIKKIKPGGLKKTEPPATQAGAGDAGSGEPGIEDKKMPVDSDTDIDLAPPPEHT